MIEVLKHLDPLWYFNVKSKTNSCVYFPDYTKLSQAEKDLIDFDEGYTKLSLPDAAFQAFKKGIMSHDVDEELDMSLFNDIPVSDLYRFVRKYYHVGWSIYFCLVRFLSGNHPVKEVRALLQSLKVNRVNVYAKVSSVKPTGLFTNNTDISIILPTLNRYEQLGNILLDISRQTVKPKEIIIIDQSDPADLDYYMAYKHMPLMIIYQREKGQWHARNEAIRASSGEYLLFLDDDSRVSNDWIEQHLNALLFFKADISAGVSIPDREKISIDKTFFRYAEEFDSGNAMVQKRVFDQIQFFDQAFDGYRMGDAEWGMRAYLAGLRSISNPWAKRIHVATTKGGLRYWGSIKAFKPVSFFGPRPDVGVLYYFSKYFNKRYLLSFLIIRIFISYMPPKDNTNTIKKFNGLLLFVLLSPWWILQIFHALKKVHNMQSVGWNKASGN